MINLNIHNETSRLKKVIFGLPNDFGGTPNLEDCYDPKSKYFVSNGLFPSQESITKEMNSVLKIFEKYDVQVYQQTNIKGLNQIFSRDIGFVIGNLFFLPNILEDRSKEQEAIKYVLDQISEDHLVYMPKNTNVEGGDVMVHNDFVFIGYSNEEDFKKYTVARTNKLAVDFIRSKVVDKKIIGFELNKSDSDPFSNALHLDCCFQPFGSKFAIMYEQGFKYQKDVDFLNHLFGEENIIRISQQEMYEMNSNIFSISDNVVISEERFSSLNNKLKDKGITVELVPYSEISKMEGLLRCSTLPLQRI